MLHTIPSFYISYRTGDVTEAVDAIVDHLVEHVGDRDKVFYDRRTIEGGEKWTELIEARVRGCSVFIAIIGPRWGEPAEHSSAANSQAISDPLRWVRKEMLLAFQEKKLILPILVDFEEKELPKLPANLRRILKKQALRFSTVQLKSPFPVQKLHHTVSLYVERFRKKPVAFVSSTLTNIGAHSVLDGLDFFTNLLSLLVQTIHRNGQEVVLKVPSYSSDDDSAMVAGKQFALIREVLAEQHRYQGVIIAPFSVNEELANAIASARKQHPHFPIALIDKGVCFAQPKSLVKRIGPIISVENDALFNGWLAGLCILEYLVQMGLKDANVAIICGLEGSKSRIAGFESFFEPSSLLWRQCWGKFVKDQGVFGDANGQSRHSGEKGAEKILVSEIQPINATFRKTAPLAFTKDAGREAINGFLRDKGKRLHAIFACNDELALGADMALKEALGANRGLRKRASPSSYPCPIPIVGFDGIRDAVRQLKSHEGWLLNTINVDLAGQVTRLGELFRVASEAGATESRLSNEVELVRGRRVLSFNEQKKRREDLVRRFPSP